MADDERASRRRRPAAGMFLCRAGMFATLVGACAFLLMSVTAALREEVVFAAAQSPRPGQIVLPKNSPLGAAQPPPRVQSPPPARSVPQSPAPVVKKSESARDDPAEPAAEEQAPPSAADGEGAPAAPAAEKGTWEKNRGTGARVKLFGAPFEFRSKLKDTPQWERVVAAERKNPGLDNPRGPASGWPALRGRLKGVKPMEQLVEVNRFFNRWPYRLDMEAYGVLDYWATTREFMEKSGDCEDYAIIKYYALRQLGVDPDSMRIVVLVDTIRNLAHAVLAVYLDNDAYILDNLSNLVMSHSRLRHYKPQFSVNENYRWVYPAVKK